MNKPHPSPLLIGEGTHEVLGEVSTQDSSAEFTPYSGAQNDNLCIMCHPE